MLNLAKRFVTWDKKELFTRRENESLKSKLISIVETIEIILSIVQKLARGIAIINRFTDCPRTSIELNFYPTNFVRQFWLINNVINIFIFINWKTNNEGCQVSWTFWLKTTSFFFTFVINKIINISITRYNF